MRRRATVPKTETPLRVRAPRTPELRPIYSNNPRGRTSVLIAVSRQQAAAWMSLDREAQREIMRVVRRLAAWQRRLKKERSR